LPRAPVLQNSFLSGEISPRLFARSDFEKFHSGVAELLNYIILPHGGVRRRPGLKFVAEVKTSSAKTRLLPFSFSDEQSYILELGNGYIRFYKNSAKIVSGDTDASIANGTFASDIASWTARNAGTGAVTHESTNDTLKLTGAGSGNEARAYQSVTVGSSYRSNEHVIKFRVYSGTAKFRIGTSAGGEQLFTTAEFEKGYHCVAFTPGASPVYVEFEENESASCEVDDISLVDNAQIEIDSPYATANLFQLQRSQSADTMWLTHRLTKPYKLTRSGHTSWSLTEYTPTADPFTSTNNYPGAVGFWKNRLWFGGTEANPNTVYSTKAGNVEDMTTGTDADHGITIALFDGEVNKIVWLRSAGNLLVGTVGGEHELSGDSDGVVTPGSISSADATEHGCALVRPEKIGSAVVFLQRAGRKYRQIVFDLNTEKLVAPDLTILSEHITTGGITEFSYAQEPDSILWGVRSDGTLISMTFMRDQNVVGFGRHTTAGSFETVATIPHQDGDRDQTWVIVSRTVGGATKRYVEYFDDGDGFYGVLGTDSALTLVSGSAQSSVSGLTHLEGLSVDIVGDGAVYPRATVSSGAVALSPTAKDIEVGLPYTSTLKTLRPATQDGVIESKKVSRSRIIVRLYQTIGLTVNDQLVPFRSSNDEMDQPPDLFTGELEIIELNWDEDGGVVTVTQTQPLPSTILSVSGDIEWADT